VGDPPSSFDDAVERLRRGVLVDDAEAYVTPVADDCVGIAILTARRGGFDEHFAAFPALQERVSGTLTALTARRARCGRGAQPDGGQGDAGR